LGATLTHLCAYLDLCIGLKQSTFQLADSWLDLVERTSKYGEWLAMMLQQDSSAAGNGRLFRQGVQRTALDENISNLIRTMEEVRDEAAKSEHLRFIGQILSKGRRSRRLNELDGDLTKYKEYVLMGYVAIGIQALGQDQR
jgi:hypothetical protein